MDLSGGGPKKAYQGCAGNRFVENYRAGQAP
jgi:hypothetical protein